MEYKLYWIDENQTVQREIFSDLRKLFDFANPELKDIEYFYLMPRTGSWIHREIVKGKSISFTISKNNLPILLRMFLLLTE